MRRLILITLSVASLSTFAADRAKVPRRENDIDDSHSGVVFGWNHFGFSNPTARFDKIEGSVLLDKADLTKSSISVTLPLEGLDTRVAKLDEVLKSPDFLDATKYPTITFTAPVEKAGENRSQNNRRPHRARRNQAGDARCQGQQDRHLRNPWRDQGPDSGF
jgi:polyisoprenoid-binding protein YceI